MGDQNYCQILYDLSLEVYDSNGNISTHIAWTSIGRSREFTHILEKQCAPIGTAKLATYIACNGAAAVIIFHY